MIGRKVGALISGPHAGVRDNFIERYIADNHADIVGIAREAEGRRKDGTTIPVEVGISQVRYDDSRLIVGFARDLSMQRKVEAEVEDLRKGRVAAVGGMAVALAHEINQPFQAALVQLNTARDRLQSVSRPADPDIAGPIAAAEMQILRAGEIIRHLREFVSSGEPNKTYQSLRRLIDDAIGFMSEPLAQSGVEIVRDLKADRDRVLVDKVQIKQVLVNLIRNARQAMAPVARRRLVISTRSIPGEAIRIDIADTGVGLTPEVASRLFETVRHDQGSRHGDRIVHFEVDHRGALRRDPGDRQSGRRRGLQFHAPRRSV